MQKYITETFVLNPPKFNFTNLDDFKNEIIYIKRDEKDYIPCLFIQDINRCNKFLLFFHGNSEHIFDLEMEAGIMREELMMNIIVVEYPGYSIYISQKSPKKILEDSIIVYDYIKEKFNLKDEDIFLYGRSIGSSPSIYLASKRKANALFVISGFSSLKNVGRGLLVGWAIEDIFKNYEYIPKVTIPIYLIHGKNDSLISYEQTLELFNNCTSKIKDFKIIEKMSHNNYNLIEDILNNIRSFLFKNNININRVNDYYNLYNKKYDDMFIMPEYILKFLDNLNFNFEAYSKLNKNFQNQIQFILLLENERIAIIYNYEISICDTLNFNKFCSIKDNNKIIFANKLKNGNILYCNDNSICKIVKIEFSQFFSYDIKEVFKIDNFRLNHCKIIEINNENFISLMESYYPLQIISKNKTSEYQCQKISIFENMLLNDIIYLEDNRIAAVFKNRNILIIYNYIDNKKQEVTFPFKNNYINPKLFFFENEYIFILFNNFIIVYDLLLTKIIKAQAFIFKTKYIANTFTVNNSYQEIFLSYIYYINTKCLIIGTDDGKALLYNFEKNLYENNNQAIFSDDNSLTLDKSDKTKIKNILLLSNKTMCILTEQNLFIFFKNKSVNKSQSCLII